jgi:hypothetical protein
MAETKPMSTRDAGATPTAALIAQWPADPPISADSQGNETFGVAPGATGATGATGTAVHATAHSPVAPVHGGAVGPR